MFENIASAIKKILPKDQTSLYVILLLLLVFAIFFYSNSKTQFFDSMDTGVSTSGEKAVGAVPVPTAPMSNVPAQQSAGAGYALQPVANPSDLLPKDQNSQWSALNPSAMNKGDILMPDLLQAGYHIGLDTIGQTLRNPNLQLRSDPIISKTDIGPWNNSTIEPDLGRVPLELGAGAR
uniref:Minor capsid protein P11 C-terminal conserved region domain-containing protein n=1 Tax=viral metagenome TaxID=1070528 RepID=A0A6C0DCA6_9ZZZZ